MNRIPFSVYDFYDAWNNRDLTKITNNQAGSILLDISDSLSVYVTCEAFAKASRSASRSRARSADEKLVGSSVFAVVAFARCRARSTSAARGSRLLVAASARRTRGTGMRTVMPGGFSSSLMAHLPRERSITLE